VAKSEYTLFEGDINNTRTELKKASDEGRKPLLWHVETDEQTKGPMKIRTTTYSILFEKTVD
jgi:hypothetical protein